MAPTVIDQQRPALRLTDNQEDSAGTRTALVLVAITVISLVVSVAGLATRHIDAGISAASMSLLAAGASLAYRSTEVRRVRNVNATGTASRLESEPGGHLIPARPDCTPTPGHPT